MLSSADIEKLLEVSSEDPLILSLYAEMPRSPAELRQVPDRIGRLLAAAADAQEGRVPRQALAAAGHDTQALLEAAARQRRRPGHCAAVFLCRPAGLAELFPLPAGPGDRAVFASRPQVRPLLTALQRWPGYRAALVTRQRAWLLAVDGEHVGVRGTGPDGWDWLRSRPDGERIGRFPSFTFRDAVAMLHAAGSDEPLVIGGLPGVIPGFFAALPGSARDRFAGSFAVDPLMVTPARIRELADPVVRHSADRSEHELLTRIRGGLSAGTATAGLGDCLAAVNRDMAAVLAISGQAMVPGYACRRCGMLGVTGAGCTCGHAAARRVPDLIEEMTAAVIRAGGTARTADGLPGGIGCCLRPGTSS